MNPENHTNSYYANSIKKETNYPVLDEELTTDICIVGGGFSGVSACLLYTSPSPRDRTRSRMPSSA